jgi:glycosyltransferase involved in cell wall biosynthesis
MDLIGVLFSRNFPPASRFYWSRYLPSTLRAAKHVVTLSENTRNDVLKLAPIPSGRISVIPPGVGESFRIIEDAGRLRATAARLGLASRFFLFVSTLEPRKGIDTLLDAYAKIAGQVSEHLVIVGKRGWYYETLFARVKALNLETRVHFADYMSDDDLPVLYNLATAFVFPSRYEGFGLTPLEAMACGTPVVSSNAASLPEVIGQAGILLAPADTDGFARAMGDLSANEPARADLRERGLKRASTFSWERTAYAMQDLYARVLENPVLKRGTRTAPHAYHD